MGSVGRIDQIISRYQISVRCKKWYSSILYNIISYGIDSSLETVTKKPMDSFVDT